MAIPSHVPARNAAARLLLQRATSASFPFDAYRQARFPHGPVCPHCSGRRIQRWGGFAGRRRYRCRACRRTFSDFTATPLAYLKKVERWPAFCTCLIADPTVRDCAAQLGVDPTTAFRWRHRALYALEATDDVTFQAQVSLVELWFARSAKGARNLDREPRRRAARFRYEVEPVWVLVARDPRGATRADICGRRYPGLSTLVAWLRRRVGKDVRVVSRSGRFGATARAARQLGLHHRFTRGGSAEIADVRRYTVRLRHWLGPFRGVATRYLDHYLAWHRSTTREAGRDLLERLVVVSALAAGKPQRRGAAGAWAGCVPA